jgi:hypothetical protein
LRGNIATGVMKESARIGSARIDKCVTQIQHFA